VLCTTDVVVHCYCCALMLLLCTAVVVVLSPAGASSVMCWPLQTAAAEELGEAAVQSAGMNAAAAGFGGVLLSMSPMPAPD